MMRLPRVWIGALAIALGCQRSPKTAAPDNPCATGDSMAIAAPRAPEMDSMPRVRVPHTATPMPNPCTDTLHSRAR